MIDDFDVVEHETVLSAAGDNRDALVQTALATFVGRHAGIEKGLVGIGVPARARSPSSCRSHRSKRKRFPKSSASRRCSRFRSHSMMSSGPTQLFDSQPPDVEVGIFAMRRELVNEQIKFFTDAKLNVQVVQMSPLAVYNAMYYDNRVKGTTMIVDLGAENTDLIIADGRGRLAAVDSDRREQLHRGADQVASRSTFDKAEELKRNASDQQVQQARSSRPCGRSSADLVSEIQRSMGFYSARPTRTAGYQPGHRVGKHVPPARAAERYLQQNLSLEVKALTSAVDAGVMEDPKAGGRCSSENLLSAAGAYGLALQVMGQGKISSNLLPAAIRKEKMWKEKTKWFGAAAAMVLLGTARRVRTQLLRKHTVQQR